MPRGFPLEMGRFPLKVPGVSLLWTERLLVVLPKHCRDTSSFECCGYCCDSTPVSSTPFRRRLLTTLTKTHTQNSLGFPAKMGEVFPIDFLPLPSSAMNPGKASTLAPFKKQETCSSPRELRTSGPRGYDCCITPGNQETHPLGRFVHVVFFFITATPVQSPRATHLFTEISRRHRKTTAIFVDGLMRPPPWSSEKTRLWSARTNSVLSCVQPIRQ